MRMGNPATVPGRPTARRRRPARGFTLIELVIVMTVIGILAAVAIPAYQDQVRRGHRASAQATMLDAVARQRQVLIDRRAYAASPAELGMAVPPAIAARYAIAFEAPGDARPPTFRIVATPTGPQAGDRCGVLTVDQAGTRSPAGCW